MNLSNYFWYFKSALTSRFCDEVIKYALEKKETMAITGGYGRDRNLDKKPLDKDEVRNLKYKRKNKTTDVLTFVSTLKNINYNKTKYCDIFFSAETIKLYSKQNKISFYDHFTHLLVHSFLHINGYMHKKENDCIKMQKTEIEILNKIGLQNPYLL